jgi:hypothetical protein
MEKHTQVYPHSAGSQYTVDDAQVVDDIFRLFRQRTPCQSWWKETEKKLDEPCR